MHSLEIYALKFRFLIYQQSTWTYTLHHKNFGKPDQPVQIDEYTNHLINVMLNI